MIFRFGSSERRTLSAEKDRTPGPGAYHPSAGGEGPRYSISAKMTAGPASDVPGPGHYDQTVPTSVREKSASYKIGTEPRNHGLVGGQRSGEGSGPMYHWELPPSPPIWGFGSQEKGWKNKSEAPGPGQYDIPTTIAVVPPYTKPV